MNNGHETVVAVDRLDVERRQLINENWILMQSRSNSARRDSANGTDPRTSHPQRSMPYAGRQMR